MSRACAIRSLSMLGGLALLISCELVAQEPRSSAPPHEEYLNLLRRPEVSEEVGLDEAQAKEIHRLHTARGMIVSTAMSDINLHPDREERAAIYRKMREEIANQDQAALALLRPEQQQRLKQISAQRTVRATDRYAGLTHPLMVSALGLTEVHLQVIRDKAQAIDQRLQTRLQELRKQEQEARENARQELLALLSEEQRKTYRDLLGDIVEPTSAAQLQRPLAPPPADRK